MIRIHILIENTRKNSRYTAKHGIAIAIDHPEGSILLDTGPNRTFIKNAQVMDYPLSEIKTVVLSHSHSDHTGGLDAFCSVNKTAEILLRDDVNSKYIVKMGGLVNLSVGTHISPETERRMTSISGNHQVRKNVWFIPNTSNTFDKPYLNRDLYKKENRKLLHDTFDHEGILVMEDTGELVIFNSCSHNGILNSIDSAEKTFPGKKVRAYVGGLHMANPVGRGNEPDDSILKICSVLKEKGIHVYTGHCTGKRNIPFLQKELGKKLTAIRTGMILEV